MISINATLILTILNFILLIAVLSSIVWKPLLKFLDERAQKIDDSLKLAEENEKRAEQLKIEHDEILREARTKASEIVDKATAAANEERKSVIAEAREQAQGIVDSTKKELTLEAEKIKHDLRQDIASMTVSLAEKVLTREISDKEHKDIINKSLDAMGV